MDVAVDLAMMPTLYSFRRCPYAMRARLALLAADIQVDLREVVLRDKPQAFLEASPSGTVPCLVLPDQVIDESLDIMIWAFLRSDPQRLHDMPDAGWELIARCDGPFKHALDRTKYTTRYPDENPDQHRADASRFLSDLDAQIDTHLFDRPLLADLAIAPFVRQFAFIDKPWFDAQPWPSLQGWLDRFLSSDAFAFVMVKYPAWVPGDAPTHFPSKDQTL
jgi:glutathione S-transferase